MPHLPSDASDADLVAFVDQWAALMEAEDYAAAFAYTDHVPQMKWSAELMRKVIKSYGDAEPTQKVTVDGQPTDITQRKEVDRWEANSLNETGEIWYDLNIDGFVSDLTATFRIVSQPEGLIVRLSDIHVM